MPRRNELAPEVANALVDAYAAPATPAGAVTANPRILRQAARNRQAFERPPVAQGGSGALEYAAAALAPVPIAGDIAGFANDVNQMRLNPETRTRLNMGLAALGLIPFVPPAVSYGLGRLAQARGVTIAPRPVGPGARQAGVFGGERAKTADLEALAIAKALQAAGHNDRNIYARTGWFKGVDGNWRFEIDDSQAKFIGDFKNAAPTKANKYTLGGISAPMNEMLSHNPLFQAYETIPDITTQVRRRDFIPDAFGTGSHRAGQDERITANNMTVEGARSTLLHELQHAVQSREGFALGSSVRNSGGFEAYRRTPGEVEARAVEARKDMTPEQRRAAFPPDSYDTRPTPILYAPGVSRDTIVENVFSSLPDATLYQLRKSAQEAAARSNDPAAIFRLQKIDEELAQRGR